MISYAAVRIAETLHVLVFVTVSIFVISIEQSFIFQTRLDNASKGLAVHRFVSSPDISKFVKRLAFFELVCV